MNRFHDETRPLCNFLERFLKREKIRSDFSWICFSGIEGVEISRSYVNSLNRLVVEFPVVMDSYFGLNEDKEKYDFFINLVRKGLELIEEKYPVLVSILRKGVCAFQAEKYKNEWILKKGNIKLYSFSYEIKCFLMLKSFRVEFSLMDKNGVFFKEVAIETPPNEFCFAHLINDVKERNNDIIIIRRDKLVSYCFEYTRIPRLFYAVYKALPTSKYSVRECNK
jgi:hypothetical protein